MGSAGVVDAERGNVGKDPGNDGLFFGNPGQLWTQLVAVVFTLILAIVGTFIILSIVKAMMGLRVADEEEQMGLDLSQHNERAYE